MAEPMARPFTGIRVLGADVLKIEEPETGDVARQTGCDRALNRRLMGTSYLTQNGNKRSMTLNVKDPRGRDLLRRLAERADVLVENYRTGAMAALGLGYDDLRARNSRLIYCSMTGFGQEGPKATHNAYDCVIQAISGLMSTTGWPGLPAVKTGAPVIDYASGLNAAFAIACALYQRSQTGRGQRIDCAMLDTALMLMSSLVTASVYKGVTPSPRGNDLDHPGVSAYDTQDGVLMLGSFRAGQHRRLWTALTRPDLAALSSVEEQEDHREEMAEALRKALAARPAEEWERFFTEIDVPAARVHTLLEALGLPHVQQRGFLHRYEAIPGVERPITVPVAGFRFAEGGPSVDTPPPRLGADTDAVLRDLGLTDAEVSGLHRDRVV